MKHVAWTGRRAELAELAELAALTAMVAVLMAPAAPARAQSFTETFDGPTLDSSRWQTGASGITSLALVDGALQLGLGQRLDSFIGVALKEPVTGDFTVTLDYRLLSWPADNKAQLVLNAYFSDSNQVGVIRMSDARYDVPRPQPWPAGYSLGEVYMMNSDVLGFSTLDRAGSLKLERRGDVVAGYHRLADGSWFDVLKHHAAPGENQLPRILGFGLGVAPGFVADGVVVQVDNFALNPVPEPGTARLWLLALGLGGAWLAGRRRSASVGRAR